jgi:hypothetical protein
VGFKAERKDHVSVVGGRAKRTSQILMKTKNYHQTNDPQTQYQGYRFMRTEGFDAIVFDFTERELSDPGLQ